MENGNQAAESNADHCRQQGGKEGIPREAPAAEEDVTGTAGKQWATGARSATINGRNFAPTQIKGYWTAIREGDDWKYGDKNGKANLWGARSFSYKVTSS
jgi:hypothetical protein